MPQSVIDKFSRNSKRIEKESAAQGVTDGIGKHKVADKLRESKKADLPDDLLMADWQEQADGCGEGGAGKSAGQAD